MHHLRLGLRFIGVLCAAALISACGATNAQAPTQDAEPTSSPTASKVNVVATTSIIGDLAQNVGGERVNVRVILPPGTDPHSYAPTPADVQAISEAQLLLQNGLGLEEWLEELIANAGGTQTTVVVSEGITPLGGGDDEHGDDEHAAETATTDEHSDDEHGHEGADPHMWFDVRNTIRYVEHIRDGLKGVDPAGAATYDEQAAAYIKQLEALDAEIIQLTESVPAERRKLITNHDTFGYFAERYDYTIVGNVFSGVSTEQEPSAQQVAELVRLIREQNVAAVFTENTVNPRLAEQIAAEAGVDVVTTLYTDALGEPGSEGDSYIKMMRYDVQQIVEALK